MKKFFSNGAKEYFNENGYFHNENGTAVIDSNGSKAWLINGDYHKEDGPAVVFNSGKTLYFYKGKRIYVNSTEEFKRYIKLLAFI